jgi:hypothetical protein
MFKRKLLVFVCLTLGLVALSWGIDRGWAQTGSNNQQTITNYDKLQEELAAKRREQGQMRGTSPSERKAAAQQLKALLDAQQQQNAPQGEVNK